MATRDLSGSGTSEIAWTAASFPPLDPASVTARRVVLVAPHPDDEILGAGGTVAMLSARGTDILLIAVTDGEASHPDRADVLRARRPEETSAALAALALDNAAVLRLHHVDGSVDATRLAHTLSGVLVEGDLVLAPWSGDGHPDHDLVGGVCEEVCAVTGIPLWSYLVWTWHWADRSTEDVPWSHAQRVDLSSQVRQMKANAIACFTSQITGPDPVLSAGVLARFHRPWEVFLTPRQVGTASPNTAARSVCSPPNS